MKVICQWVISAPLLIVMGFSSIAHASTISVSALDWGWYRSDGRNQPNSDNYITGLHITTAGTASEFRSWFAFDLNGIGLGANESISSVSLSIAISGNYVSGDSSEELVLASIESNVNDIMLGNGVGVDIYNDLKDGDIYGSQDVASTFFNSNASINMVFSGSSALSRITNDLGGLFAVGAYINTIDLSSFASQELFSASGGFSFTQSAAVLTIETRVLAVPVPSAFWLFSSGILGFVGLARREKKA